MIKRRYLIQSASIGFNIIVSSSIALLLLCTSFYIHEAGHVIFGFIANLLHLKFNVPSIITWKMCSFIPVPQQTSNIEQYFLFAFGGVIFSSIFYIYYSYYLSKKYNLSKSLLYILAGLLIFREIFGNIIFGNDNLINNPLLIKEDHIIINFVLENILYLLTIIIFFAIYKRIYNYIKDAFFFKKKKKKMTNSLKQAFEELKREEDLKKKEKEIS